MSNGDDLRDRLKRASREAADETDRQLEAEITALKSATTADLEALKPHITDAEIYAQLIAAVKESTDRNESIAQLRDRVKRLGAGVLGVAKKAVGLLG